MVCGCRASAPPGPAAAEAAARGSLPRPTRLRPMGLGGPGPNLLMKDKVVRIHQRRASCAGALSSREGRAARRMPAGPSSDLPPVMRPCTWPF